MITPGQRLSFLQQDHFKYDEYTVLDTVIMGNKRLYDIMKEKDAIYMKEDFTDEDGMDRKKERVQENYNRIKEDVKQIVRDELERIANDDNLKHLLQTK